MFPPPTAGFTKVEQDYLFEFITEAWEAHQVDGVRDGLHALQEIDGLFPPGTRCYDTIHKMIQDAHQVQYDTVARPSSSEQTGSAREVSLQAVQLQDGQSVTIRDATITRVGGGNPSPPQQTMQTRVSPSRAPRSAADQLRADDSAQMEAEAGSQLDEQADKAWHDESYERWSEPGPLR